MALGDRKLSQGLHETMRQRITREPDSVPRMHERCE